MKPCDHSQDDASLSLVWEHNRGRTVPYGVIVPYDQARRYLELEQKAKRHKVHTMADTILAALFFLLGLTLGAAIF